MGASNIDLLVAERVGVAGWITVEEIVKLVPIHKELGGQFLLDPNEFNGWGAIGPTDNTNSQDLGNVGAGISRIAGGLTFSFDVKLVSFEAWHYNTATDAQAWGWRIARQLKNAGSNAVTNNSILRECTGDGATAIAPRDYGNTATQRTSIDLSASAVIPAGEVVILGVEAPTAVTTNRYVRILSGHLTFMRA